MNSSQLYLYLFIPCAASFEVLLEAVRLHDINTAGLYCLSGLQDPQQYNTADMARRLDAAIQQCTNLASQVQVGGESLHSEAVYADPAAAAHSRLHVGCVVMPSTVATPPVRSLMCAAFAARLLVTNTITAVQSCMTHLTHISSPAVQHISCNKSGA